MRKSSPGKTLFSSATVLQSSLDRSATSPVRSLDFSNSQAAPQLNQSLNQTSNPVPLQSWADKVRGTTSSRNNATVAVKTTVAADRQSQNSNSWPKCLSGNVGDSVVQDMSDDGDDEGWETVHRGRKVHSNHARRTNKVTHKQASNGRTVVTLNHPRAAKTMNGIHLHSNGEAVDQRANEKAGNQPIHPLNPAEAPEKSIEISNGEDVEIPLDHNSYEEQASLSDIEHEKALSAATEQEESLSRQIEECQNQMIASVIEHEESLTKEIAEEEELVTAINGESESRISDMEQKEQGGNINEVGDDSLNCSEASNGESVSAYTQLIVN